MAQNDKFRIFFKSLHSIARVHFEILSKAQISTYILQKIIFSPKSFLVPPIGNFWVCVYNQQLCHAKKHVLVFAWHSCKNKFSPKVSKYGTVFLNLKVKKVQCANLNQHCLVLKYFFIVRHFFYFRFNLNALKCQRKVVGFLHAENNRNDVESQRKRFV